MDADSFFRQGQEPIHLSEMQVGFLVEFLKSLTDPCTQDRACLSPWVPAEDNGDDNQLEAYDQAGLLRK